MTHEAARPDLVLRDGAGNTLVREVVRMALFFATPHQSMKDAARQAIVDYVRVVSLDALPYHYGGPEGEPVKLTPDGFDEQIDVRFRGERSSWPNASLDFFGLGGSPPEYGLQYRGKALNTPSFPDDTSFLNVWMPRDWFLLNAKTVGGYFRSTVVQSSASAAYVSPSLSGGTMRVRQGLAKRYLGLDIGDPGSVSEDLGIRAPGSYWINYLGPDLTRRAGGGEAIRAALPPEVVVEALPGESVLVRLGRDIQLGDRNRREDLPAYRAFARFMDSKGLLHVPRQVAYFEDERGLADRSAQEAWHRRFLEPPS